MEREWGKKPKCLRIQNWDNAPWHDGGYVGPIFSGLCSYLPPSQKDGLRWAGLVKDQQTKDTVLLFLAFPYISKSKISCVTLPREEILLTLLWGNQDSVPEGPPRGQSPSTELEVLPQPQMVVLPPTLVILSHLEVEGRRRGWGYCRVPKADLDQGSRSLCPV